MPLLDNAYALIVGIANYQHVTSLPPTVRNDAQDIHDLLIDPLSCGYQSSNVRLLLDEQSTKVALNKELATLAQRCASDSTVFVYISSHGGQIQTGPYAGEYLLPADTVYTSVDSLAQTAISSTEFTET